MSAEPEEIELVDGTSIRMNQLGHERYDYIIDKLVTPSIIEFRELHVYNERATLMPDRTTWKLSYSRWNPEADFSFYRNGGEVVIPDSIDYAKGTFKHGVPERGDSYRCSYVFDYFGSQAIAGFIDVVVGNINTGAFGPPSNFTVESMPEYWDGVVAQLVVSKCMERLISAWTVWRGKLLFGLTGNQLEDGSGDAPSSLLDVKKNAEEWAYRALENEQFKNPPYLSKPTGLYYRAVRGGSRAYGGMRGYRKNKIN